MEVKEALRSLFKEIILPELTQIKTEQIKIGERLNGMDQRLADINAHLVDQSRRIDETNKRIDETNKRIDSVRDELVGMIDKTNKRIDRLYEVIVRREEHTRLETKMENFEMRLATIERKLAA